MRPAILVCLLLCAAATAAADREAPVARPLADAVAEVRADCPVGNSLSATTYSGWWAGFESYARLIEADAGVCGCGVGVSVRSASMRLLVPAGAMLYMQARLLAADVGPGGCLTPGQDLAWSGPVIVNGGSAPSLRDVTIPCDFVCAEVGADYFIAVDFVNGGATGLQLIGGGGANDCVTWNDWGTGWVDLVGEMGFFDDLTIWADLDCCYEAVGSARETWGSVKSGYR